MRLVLSWVLVAMFTAPVFGQTSTPTIAATQTPTVTPTPTLGKKPGTLLWRATCASTPCDSPDLFESTHEGTIEDPGGHKSVVCTTHAGTATLDVICRPGGGQSPDVTMASLSGATCATKANCLAEFDASCDDLFVRIAACSACTVSCWARVSRPR